MNIPIIGQKTETIPFEPYDSEIILIESVLNRLSERARDQRRDYSLFDAEAKERFYDAGFLVTIAWFETDQPDVKMPEITVVGRVQTVERGDFDHDRMRHEVTEDILEIGQKGTIHVDKAAIKKAIESERNHGHS